MKREPARDTLAPSSFGVLGGAKPSATAPAPMIRSAREPMPTLGDLEGATATATLRPPGAVPPPPRALPTPASAPDAASAALERGSALDTPFPDVAGGDQPFTTLAGDLPVARATPPAQPAEQASLESTLDMSGSASRKATQAALIDQTRAPEPVPAPGLFIADEPLEPRPQQLSLASEQRRELSRMRIAVMLLGGLLMMLAGALVVMIFRRSEAQVSRDAAPPASAAPAPAPPGCSLTLPPSRISPTIERSVPISAVPLTDGGVALGIASAKDAAAGWLYDVATGEPARALESPAGGGDISHVTAADPLLVDRTSPDFAFARTLAPGLSLGVGPAGLLRRGAGDAAGVVWPLPAGARVTPPRAVAVGDGYFVAFRQGGAEGRIVTGWLRADGSAASELSAVPAAPKNLGTPNVALAGKEALVLFPARGDKTEPYRIHVARVAPGVAPGDAQALELPAEGGGAIAPSLAPLDQRRFVVQWTDGTVGRYRVHVRVLDDAFRPISEPLLISAKGANAGQGTIVVTGTASVSFFIQTTAGHDELWGASLSCR